MPDSYKLSLPAAIIININIMLGAGIFLNSLTLANFAGLLGWAVYALVGVLMLPLVLCIANLSRLYPAGSFYTFGSKEINKITGFLCIWSYFTAKLASSTLMIHFFSLIISNLIPFFSNINIFVLDLILLAIFTLLNMLNLKSGMKIQILFMVLKAMPILFVILSGLFLFTAHNITAQNLLWSGILPSIPLVIYAFTGFESACSLSRHIRNPDKNAPKAILISYGIVILILCLYQFLFFITIGPTLAKAGHYFEAFPLLFSIIPISELFKFKLLAILQLAIATSALGGAYGILYSNNWNLYTLVENKHVFFANLLAKLNRFNIPYICIMIETFICISYLFITNGEKIPLQQISALGSTIAYTICSVALLYANKKEKKSIWLPILAIFNCLLLITFCINGLFLNGIYPLIIFITILVAGLIMFKITSKKQYLH